MNDLNEEKEYEEIWKAIDPLFFYYSSDEKLIVELSDIMWEVERRVRRRRIFEEYAWKEAEGEYKYYDQKCGSEYWWQTLKKNWGDKGVKSFIFEFVRRKLIQDTWVQVLKNFDIIEKILENASAYSNVEEAIRELEEKGLFPPEGKDSSKAVMRAALIDCRLPPERQAKTAEELALKVHRWFGVKVTADDVKKILEEELAKLYRGEKINIVFELLGREGWKAESYLWKTLRLKSLEGHVREWTLKMVIPGRESLDDLVKMVQKISGFEVTKDEARKWIMEELEKPLEEAHRNIKLYRWVAEKLVK
jgi:hypothetical protein